MKSAVDEYLEGVAEPARTTLGKLRATIRAAAPRDATEGISYGMPAFLHHGPLIGYSASAKHCSLHPMNESLVAQFAEELAGYSTSKRTIRFAVDKPLPAALVKKIVKARVAENESRK